MTEFEAVTTAVGSKDWARLSVVELTCPPAGQASSPLAVRPVSSLRVVLCAVVAAAALRNCSASAFERCEREPMSGSVDGSCHSSPFVPRTDLASLSQAETSSAPVPGSSSLVSPPVTK